MIVCEWVDRVWVDRVCVEMMCVEMMCVEMMCVCVYITVSLSHHLCEEFFDGDER